MQIVNLVQGTQEWLDFRKTKIMASDCAKLMGKSSWGNAVDVYLSKIGDVTIPINEAMKRGSELEPQARSMINRTRGLTLEPVVAVSDVCNILGASFDGIDFDKNECYEFKCPGEKNMMKALAGEYDVSYWWQCQHQMAVYEELKCVHLVYYHNDALFKEFIIERDEGAINSIVETGMLFWNSYVMKGIQPHKSFPISVNDDERLNAAAVKWSIFHKKIKDLKEEIKSLEGEMTPYVEIMKEAGVDGAYFSTAGVKYMTYERQGLIDNERIYKEFNIDKEKYRKKSTLCTKISIE